MYTSDYWDKINLDIKKHYYWGVMYSYKLGSYLKLFKKWNINFKNKTILITDLFDESFVKENLFRHIQNKQNKVVGVDISKIIIEKAKKKNNFENLIIADIKKLPFEKEIFDIIISPSTLDHTSKKFLKSYLGELSRVLKKDGKILLTLHNKNNIYFDFFLIELFNIHQFKFEKYTVKNFNSIITDMPLNISKISSIVHLPFPFFLSMILSRIESNTSFGRKLLSFLLNFENINNNKLFNNTGQLLAFELTKI